MEPPQPVSSNPAAVTVVVVDDDPQMRMLVGRILKAEGYDVRTVDGADAARALLGTLNKVDILLTDVAMPDASGSDLVAGIRSTHPQTRIVYMSSYSPEELKSYGVDAPGAQLLSKPFAPSELLAKLREVLGSSQ